MFSCSLGPCVNTPVPIGAPCNVGTRMFCMSPVSERVNARIQSMEAGRDCACVLTPLVVCSPQELPTTSLFVAACAADGDVSNASFRPVARSSTVECDARHSARLPFLMGSLLSACIDCVPANLFLCLSSALFTLAHGRRELQLLYIRPLSARTFLDTFPCYPDHYRSTISCYD